MNLKTNSKNTSCERTTKKNRHMALVLVIAIGLCLISGIAIYLHAGETRTAYGECGADTACLYTADALQNTGYAENVISEIEPAGTAGDHVFEKLAAIGGTDMKAVSGLQSAFGVAVEAYNEAVEAYNTEAGHYNDFVSLLSSYGLVSRKAEIPVMEPYEESYEEFLTSGREASWLSESRKRIADDTDRVKEKNLQAYSQSLNLIVESYNEAAAEFNDKVKNVSVDFINGMHIQFLTKGSIYVSKNWTYEMAVDKFGELMDDYGILNGELRIVNRISCPSDLWVSDCLKSVPDVTYTATVTEDKDPNGLLGKKGGYTGCVYFNVKKIQMSDVKGSGLVDKGTDAGGAVEIYATKEDAFNRCDYLSQFDNTLLYSGSYAVIGTMVVRTSYRLTDEEQIDLTNAIVEALCGE